MKFFSLSHEQYLLHQPTSCFSRSLIRCSLQGDYQIQINIHHCCLSHRFTNPAAVEHLLPFCSAGKQKHFSATCHLIVRIWLKTWREDGVCVVFQPVLLYLTAQPVRMTPILFSHSAHWISAIFVIINTWNTQLDLGFLISFSSRKYKFMTLKSEKIT